MVGIYKITNNLNGHCYIGQSRNINKRWSDHKVASGNKNDKAYNYPLYRAFRKYVIRAADFIWLQDRTFSVHRKSNGKRRHYC